MQKHVAGYFVQLLCLYSNVYMVFFLYIVRKLTTAHLTLF